MPSKSRTRFVHRGLENWCSLRRCLRTQLACSPLNFATVSAERPAPAIGQTRSTLCADVLSARSRERQKSASLSVGSPRPAAAMDTTSSVLQQNRRLARPFTLVGTRGGAHGARDCVLRSACRHALGSVARHGLAFVLELYSCRPCRQGCEKCEPVRIASFRTGAEGCEKCEHP
jgi:hypothetical protein